MAPPPGRALLGIDLGTSSVKVALVDAAGPARGRVLATATEPYPVSSPRPGWAETDPAAWLDAVARAVRTAVGAAGRPAVRPEEVAVRPEEVAGIGLSGQMHGLVLTAPDGTPTRPALLHLDTRATTSLAAYRALPTAVLDRLANPLTPSMTGPMLLWAARHEPDAYRGARWALQPKDWLRLRLTGVAASEPSDASATLLYDLPGDRWDLECTDLLGLEARLLAPLLPAGTAPAGRLTPDAAALLGLTAGIPVAAGGGDTAVAAIGSGLVRAGDVLLTVGTGGQVTTPRDSPESRPERGTNIFRTALPGGWYAMGAVLSAGASLDWVRRVLGVSWRRLYAAADAPATAADPVFLPHLSGERTPYLDPEMRGAWVGLGPAIGRDAMLRCALEGVAFALRDALDALELPDTAAAHRPTGGFGAAGSAPARTPSARTPSARTAPVRLAGGGTRAAGWRQLLADTLERPLQPLEISDVSARGAALLAGVATGLVDEAELAGELAPSFGPPVEPDAAAAAAQARRRERFLDALRALRPAPMP